MEPVPHRFPDRERAPDGEEQHRDHEAPEVHVLAVAEGVGGVGGLARPPHAHQQEDLVAGVGDGMERLGEHRGAAGDGRGDAFQQRERRVAQQGRHDRGP
jgi:hypothetical protein